MRRAAHEFALPPAARSLAQPRSLCFPRDGPTLAAEAACRGASLVSVGVALRPWKREPPRAGGGARAAAAAAAAGSSTSGAGGRDRGRQHGERLVPHFQLAGKNDIQRQGL